MALPESGPISMSMVAAEFEPEIGANMSLSASAALLSTPVGSNIFLAASFYGQSAGVAVTSFLGGSLESTGNNACAIEEPEITYYHDGSSGEPAVNDTVYTNTPGTTTLGAGHILFLVGGESRVALQINSSGVIIGSTACR
jgi:hypothetical protein